MFRRVSASFFPGISSWGEPPASCLLPDPLHCFSHDMFRCVVSVSARMWGTEAAEPTASEVQDEKGQVVWITTGQKQHTRICYLMKNKSEKSFRKNDLFIVSFQLPVPPLPPAPSPALINSTILDYRTLLDFVCVCGICLDSVNLCPVGRSTAQLKQRQVCKSCSQSNKHWLNTILNCSVKPQWDDGGWFLGLNKTMNPLC